ncbi:MAG: hypothetical protein WCK05_06465 [Planctomycetota bacterium]
MGGFFTNIQVHAGDRTPEALRSLLIEAIRRRWLDGGQLREAEQDEDADVAVAIGPAGAEPWVAVYDQATECQNGDILAEVAGELSAAAGATAVAIVGHDGDTLYLELFDKGEHRDSVLIAPEGAGDMTAGQRRKMAGKPKVWAALFPDVSVRALQQVWKSDRFESAAAALEATGAMLKWNFPLVGVGYNHIDELDRTRLTFLRFRRIVAPAPVGPPVFQVGCSAPWVCLWVDEQFEFVISVINQGGPSCGLDVCLWGAALEKGLIKVDRAELRHERPAGAAKAGGGNTQPPITRAFRPCRSTADEPMLLVSFDGVDFPGRRPPPVRGTPTPFGGNLRIKVYGSAEAVGGEELRYGVIPQAHREGSQGLAFPLRVNPRPIMPLNAPDDPRYYPPATAMTIRKELFAYVVFDGEGQALAPCLVDAFRRWHDLASGGRRGTYRTFYSGAQCVHDKSFPFKADQGPPEELTAILPSLASLITRLPDGRAQFHMSNPTLIATPALRRPEDISYACCFVNVEKATPEQAASARETLEAVVDEIAGATRILQGFAGCWEHAPGPTTQYEAACGMTNMDIVQKRSWSSRFLRAVTPTMWLGPTVLAHLPSRDALNAISDTHLTGSTLRLALRPDVPPRELEKALAPLLATQAEWSRAAEAP